MVSPRRRGPGTITVEPRSAIGMYYAYGVADVKYQHDMELRGRWVVVEPADDDQTITEDDTYWQPQVRKGAWGRSEETARERCRQKLCAALEEDANEERRRIERAADIARRTTTFDCPQEIA